ncbi:MAG: hypothetical protein GF370_04655 [Candidatus Nealsonbacteria bacterium]|nr:hypothetical protein [Candidatus Nealsonbacteria bacterium]
MEEKNHDKEGERFDSLRKDLDNIVKNSQKEEGEKLEFLERGEIKTMEKDKSRLREAEAQKEKERIVALEKEQGPARPEPERPKEKEEEEKEEAAPVQEAPSQEIIIPKPPKKPSGLRKIIVRLGFILVFAGIIFSVYMFLSSNIDQLPSPEEILSWIRRPSPPEEIEPEEEEEEEPLPPEPEIVIPPSIIPVEKDIVLGFNDSREIPSLLGSVEASDIPSQDFARVVLENNNENRLASLQELASGFQVAVPSSVLEKLNSEKFDLLIRLQEEGERILLIVKIQQGEGLANALQQWETSISQQGLPISGERLQTIASRFKSYAYFGKSFRYLTVSKQDLGVCYAIFDQYLVISSSFAGMEKAIPAIQAKEEAAQNLPEDIGQIFMVGFDGQQVTPQLESFFQEYKPGGVLLLSKNINNRSQLEKLVSDLQQLSDRYTGYPLLIGVDQEGGEVCRIGFLEEKTAQSSISTEEEAYEVGMRRGEELANLGVNLNLAPLLDAMEENDFYFDRTFQKDPETTGQLAKSLVAGQKEAGIITVVKHFPGYVNIPFNPEGQLATISLPETTQFQKALEADPEGLMVSNAIYTDIDPDNPLTFSSQLLTFLEENLPTVPLIISDDLAQRSLLDSFSMEKIVSAPINSGVNMMIFSGWYAPVSQAMDAFKEAVQNNKVSQENLEVSISKIIQLKESI